MIPTLLSLSSVRVTSHILSTSLNQVTTYYERFRTRLSVLHSLHLKRLINYMEAIQKVMDDWRATRSKADSTTDARIEVFTISNFMEKLGRNAVGINLLEIEAYLKRSKVTCSFPDSSIFSTTMQIARKISGYAEVVSSRESRSRLLPLSRLCLHPMLRQTPCPRNQQAGLLRHSMQSKHLWSDSSVPEKVISSFPSF